MVEKKKKNACLKKKDVGEEMERDVEEGVCRRLSKAKGEYLQLARKGKKE